MITNFENSVAHHRSNLPGLKELPAKFFDLLIGDPPYFSGPEKVCYYGRMKEANNIKRVNYKKIAKRNWRPPSAAYFREVKRTSKHWLMFGANYYAQLVGKAFKSPSYKEFNAFLREHPRGWIIWDKCNYASRFRDCELILTNFDMPSTIYRFMWNGMSQGSSIFEGHIMQGNKQLNEKRIHQTQKPVLLCKWLLHTYGFPGATIGDTHMGSQSMRIAAHDLNMKYIGWEIDKHHFQTGCKRFALHERATRQQLKLF